MKKVYYNKIVRDKLPEIIKDCGSDLSMRTIEDADEYRLELARQLVFESQEVQREVHKSQMVTKDIVSELGDVIELVYELVKRFDIDTKELESARLQKKEKRVGFEQGVYLNWSEADKYEKGRNSV